MLSKFLRTGQRLRSGLLAVPRASANRPLIRIFGNFVPPNQYDSPFPRNFNLSYALSVHWEIWPLIVVSAFVYGVLAAAIIWACKHKVDVVYTTHSRANISRTMDLRHPTIHKIIIINQRYPPWPEMADALDKMKEAEKRVMLRAQFCNANL